MNPRGKHRTHFVPFPSNLTQIFGHTDGDPSPGGRDGVYAGSEDLRNPLPSRKVNDSYRGCATSGTVQRRFHSPDPDLLRIDDCGLVPRDVPGTYPTRTHLLLTTSRRRQKGIVYRIRKESIFQRVAFRAMHPQDGGHPPGRSKGGEKPERSTVRRFLRRVFGKELEGTRRLFGFLRKRSAPPSAALQKRNTPSQDDPGGRPTGRQRPPSTEMAGQSPRRKPLEGGVKSHRCHVHLPPPDRYALALPPPVRRGRRIFEPIGSVRSTGKSLTLPPIPSPRWWPRWCFTCCCCCCWCRY